MKYLQTETFLGDAECAGDAVKPTVEQETRLRELQAELENLGPDQVQQRLENLLESAYLQVELDLLDSAWASAHEAFKLAMAQEAWEQATQACDIIFQSEKEDAVKALAHGVWLGVTYPIDPELTVAVLHNLVDEMPPKADGTAYTAAVANYIVAMRSEGKKQEDLQFFVTQMMATVARKHSEIEEKELFDFWVEQLGLNDPARILPNLAKVLDAIVQDDWWYDRDELRSRLPGE